MPRRARTFCATSGGSVLVDSEHCSQHTRQQMKRIDSDRRTSTARGYYAHRQRLRRMKLNAHPLCECGCQGLADMVHDIDRDVRNNLWKNLMSMRTKCRSKLHAEKGERWWKRQTNMFFIMTDVAKHIRKAAIR